jgi:hypothetical protein
MPNQSPIKVGVGYSGISGSFSLCNDRKNNQGGWNVDNQGSGGIKIEMVLKS